LAAKSTALRGWTRGGITETLRALITLKGPQWSQRFQWSQWFSARAQIDAPVGEQAIEDWLRAGWLRQDHAAERVGLPFRIGDRIAHLKGPKQLQV
jgi:hypothetical protein